MEKLFLFLLIHSFLVITSSGRNSVAPAIAQIIRDFYLVQNVHFDLIVCGSNFRVNDIVNNLVKADPGETLPFRIVHLSVASSDPIPINQSAILMFDNLSSYRDFHRRVFLNSIYPKQFNILVYVEGVQESQADSLILWKNFTERPMIFQYENFLVHGEDSSLKILMFLMFQQPKCRDWVKREVNRFSVKE